jgi:3-(3-hydroxy-phenyl)propionate hydroxylase
MDDALGSGFALLAQAPDTAKFLAESQSELWPELAPARVALSARPMPAADGIAGLISYPGLALAAVRAHRDQILLIRPDRYVAAAFWPDGAAAAVAAFRAHLKPCQDS